ncbi:non-ribosomal peptide synthetase [Chitinophaga flava]|uniref:Non-ribosomal peptide synthetase n=1 Tax=Chitinophaga flava TaxID=2259036 RepID=A0A365XUQ5_9BACT|nr:non-ribosomal peptide synthetase [Chitinophaga flava]RBL90063.1 non-ribosomal peptide synthetase [Chitinophaga flava]
MQEIIKLILELADQQVYVFLEDGKLKIDAPDGVILDTVIPRIKLHKDGLIEYLSGNRHQTDAAIARAVESDSYPLSSAQRRLWVLSQFEEGSTAYNMPGVFEFAGALDIEALSRSFDTLIARHESLRTIFREAADGEVRQHILTADALNFRLHEYDFRDAGETMLQAAVRASLSRPFDLSAGPLLRAELCRINEDKWVFVYVMHHIISDGWSMEVLIRELLQLYHAYVKGQVNPLSPLRIHYKDYAVWQQQQLQSESLIEHKSYWLQQLGGELPVLELPADKPRPAIKTYNGASISRTISPAVTAGLKALCLSADSTLFMGLLAAVKALLYRYTAQEDIIIGSPVAGREHSDLEGQIGFYVNTLALRTQFSGAGSYLDLLSRVRQTTLDAYQHQSYPFDELVEELPLHRDMSRNALFDVMVVLQHQSSASLVEQGFAGLEVRAGEGTQQGSKFDLQFSFLEAGDQLQLYIAYNTDIYQPATISRLSAHLEQLLTAIIATPSAGIGAINYLSREEKTLLLETFNATEAAYDIAVTVIDLFEEQVSLTPDHIGLLYEGRSLSYSQINATANRLAHYLRDVYGIGADDLVGIQLERNEWLVIALLGVLKSGGAYVPIDPAYPQERIEYIIADSRCKVVLDDRELQKFLLQEEKYDTENPGVSINSGDLAYIIYTSGSTGRPKGVMITHSNVSAFIAWCREEFAGSAYEVVLGVTSICFDLSVFEVFFTLTSGKQLRILESGLAISGYLNSKEPLLVNTVPSVVAHLLSEGADLSRVNVLNMAGEPIPANVIRQLDCERMEVRNLYGPSEDTTYSTIYRIHSADNILIGRPISNTKIYILGDNDHLQPVGVVGEICISGAGLARGYLNQPALTAEKFVSHPFIPGERLYRTGDLGRWQSDGNIVYLGRKDDQVKVRGYRIELGEIETVLHRYPGVEAVVVTARAHGDGDKVLVAYVACKEPLDNVSLRSYLKSQLPDYMVPGYFVQLSALPLLPNGKINKKALPAPEADQLSSGREYEAPRNELESRLADIWSELLGQEQVSVKDNFFELGGHSLKATRLSSRIYKAFEVKVTLKELFTHPVLEDLARLIAGAQKSVAINIPVVPEQSSYVLSSAQRRLWVLSRFEGGSAAYNMPGVFMFEGTLNTVALSQSFDMLIARHESLRTIFRATADGDVRQYILSAPAFRVAIHDLHDEAEAVIQKAVQECVLRPFDLEEGPLLRAELYRVSEDKWVFAYVMHHIISDGWSMEVLIKELLALYQAITESRPHSLMPLRIQYKDYATWQQEQLSSPSLNGQRKWWLEHLSGELPILEFPADHPRPAVKTYQGGVVNGIVNAATVAGFKGLLRSREATLFTGLLALVKTLLYRYTGQEDMIIGMPVAGREHIDLEEQIGFYVNTLALRTQFSGTENYCQVLEKIKELTLQAQANQFYPFDELVDQLALQRDMSRHPLFDVMVVVQQDDGHSSALQQLKDLKVSAFNDESATFCKFDLLFNFIEQGDCIKTKISYNSGIYSRSTIEQLSFHLEQLLQAIVQQPYQPVQQVDFLNADEKQLLSVTFNDTARIYPTGKTIVDLFEAQAARTPDAIALVSGKKTCTYRELQEISNQLANYLLVNHHISTEDLVGVKLPRNEWLVITLLAVLKSGAAYVPIDMNYPEERIAYIELDSNCKLTITDAFLLEFSKHISSGERPQVKLHPGNLAYVIYTSGSTGKPKGVMITHSSAVTLLQWSEEEFTNTDFDIMYAVTSHCFDLSVFEIFYPLSIGKKIRVVENGAAIASWLPEDKKVLINTVPAVVNELYNNAVLSDHIAGINMAGEPIPVALSNGLLKYGIPLRNLYGPSEDTTYSSCYRIETPQEQSVSIGKPIANTQFYILSSTLALQPMLVAGEIYISGDGLSKGYLNRSELTAEKFIPNPYREGQLMYRTGDVGRWMPDGNISFAGRKDDQVKVRGYRIELGEIEHALMASPAVTDAVVLAKTQEGERYIVAYLKGTQISVDELKAHLSQRLPHYMLPAAYVVLDKLPLTPNGKVDKKALLQLEVFNVRTTAYVAPEGEVEEKLALIWQEVLKLDSVGTTDNFFEIGGQSLKMITMLNRVKTEFGFEIKLEMFLGQPTIASVALHIGNLQSLNNTAGPRANQQKIII